MTLYYDTLIPYMPDSSKNEVGEMIPNETLAAGRSAMIELAEFQTTGNLMALYQAVIFACKYAEQDLIDSILNLPKDITVSANDSVTTLVDHAAIALFRSINKEKYPFDLNLFLANILTAEHIIFLSLQQAKRNAPESNTEGNSNE